MAWVVLLTDEVADWLAELNKEDPGSAIRVAAAIEMLKEHGPALDRPLADTIKGSRIANLKELRPGSSGRKKIRILFVFDRWRQAILLVAGDKSGNWQGWYKVGDRACRALVRRAPAHAWRGRRGDAP